jgi:phosphoserine aminotransferase
MREACDSGILSVNHRSDDFIQLSQKTIFLLKDRLSIPADYSVFFISSATEAWQIIAQEFVDYNTVHVYNGAFGKKWFENSQKIKPKGEVRSLEFNLEEEISIEKLAAFKEPDLLCITQNETSNATRISNEKIFELKQFHPNTLLAVDATSSMGGEALAFISGDIWFASVQKCFGMPAGMGIMVCSPATIQRLQPCAESKYYNSMAFMNEMMYNWQTTYTPNVLSIFLMSKVLEQSSHIDKVSQRLAKRSIELYNFFSGLPRIKNLIENTAVRATTVIALHAGEKVISEIKKTAKENGMLLGNGYGNWKNDTLRIANFPAHEDAEYEKLKELFVK